MSPDVISAKALKTDSYSSSKSDEAEHILEFVEKKTEEIQDFLWVDEQKVRKDSFDHLKASLNFVGLRFKFESKRSLQAKFCNQLSDCSNRKGV
jgi:hypothetical protein